MWCESGSDSNPHVIADIPALFLGQTVFPIDLGTFVKK